MKERKNVLLPWKDCIVGWVPVRERRGFEIRRLFKSFGFIKVEWECSY